MKLPFRNNPIGLSTSSGKLAFSPVGRYTVCTVSGKRDNPVLPTGVFKDTWSARLIVGLSVRKKSVYTIHDVIAVTRAYMKAHKYPEDSSFVAQHGVFTHAYARDARGEPVVVQEKSVQIFIINAGDWSSEEDFKQFAEEFAEHLVVKFRQEMIIVEIQNNGVVKVTWLVVSRERMKLDQEEARKQRTTGKNVDIPKPLTRDQIRKS